ncbi:ABC transporter permease [Glutamicibacter sp. NPDC087344]|uniref:ABC transporter permease n=1 Tax=Glutamicibacter sp. NPDC087344 TaxID=3363994 RepID=UPI0037FC916D
MSTSQASLHEGKQEQTSLPVIGKAPFKMPAYLPVLVSTLVLVVISAVIAPRTMSSISLGAMLPFAAILAVAAVGQTLVVQQRGIDLSVGGSITLAAVLVSAGPGKFGISVFVMIPVVLVICGLLGLLNSILVSRMLITPLVATLAVNAILVGAALLFTSGSSAAAPAELSSAVSARFLGLPALLWFSLVFVAVLALVASKSVLGRQFVLTGANPATAISNGIRVQRSVVLAYVVAGVCYGIAGILLAGYLQNVTVNAGSSYLMSVIAVVIVGGTPLTGGRGTIVGTAIAALFMSQLIQLVLTLGAPTATQMLIQALAIAVAAVLGAVKLRQRRR